MYVASTLVLHLVAYRYNQVVVITNEIVMYMCTYVCVSVRHVIINRHSYEKCCCEEVSSYSHNPSEQEDETASHKCTSHTYVHVYNFLSTYVNTYVHMFVGTYVHICTQKVPYGSIVPRVEMS